MDRLTDGEQMTAMGMGGSGGIEQKGKKTHGQQCGDGEGVAGHKGVSGHGKIQ